MVDTAILGSRGSDMLSELVNYSLHSSGKRIRSVLAFAVAEELKVGLSRLEPLVRAIEQIHTASLIHDDLPALDNDDMRRGKPSLHNAYDVGGAVLAGDALFVEAFSELSQYDNSFLVRLFAETARDICAGQLADLELSKEQPQADWKVAARLRERDLLKTASLFAASAGAPCLVAGAPMATFAHYYGFGRTFGLLFQLADDLLDCGDTDSKEVSYPRVYGPGAATELADKLLAEARAYVTDCSSDFLSRLAMYIRNRTE